MSGKKQIYRSNNEAKKKKKTPLTVLVITYTLSNNTPIRFQGDNKMNKITQSDQIIVTDTLVVKLTFSKQRLILHTTCKTCRSVSRSEYNSIMWFQIDVSDKVIYLPFIDDDQLSEEPYTLDNVLTGDVNAFPLCDCGQRAIIKYVSDLKIPYIDADCCKDYPSRAIVI